MDENSETPAARTEETRKEEPRFDCATCADQGEVSVPIETFTGKRLLPMPCPDCKDNPESKGRIRVESLRDERLKVQDEKIRVLALVSVGALIAVALMFSWIRQYLDEGGFSAAVKEVTEHE